MFDPNLAVIYVFLIVLGLAGCFCFCFWLIFKVFDRETNGKKVVDICGLANRCESSNNDDSYCSICYLNSIKDAIDLKQFDDAKVDLIKYIELLKEKREKKK